MLNIQFAKNKMEFEEGMNHALLEVTPSNKIKKTSKPIAFALIIDASGSMNGYINQPGFSDPRYVNFGKPSTQESATKLDYVKQAAETFVTKLSEKDYLSIISFSDTPIVEQAFEPVSKENKKTMRESIRSISTRGMTNISLALSAAYQEIPDSIKQTHHIKMILLSDGAANSGATSPEQIASFLNEHAEEGITISSIGVGNDYNSFFMETVATTSGGMFYHLKEMEQLESIFKTEIETLNSLTMKGATITISLPNELELLPNLNDFQEKKLGNIFLGNVYSKQEVVVEFFTKTEIKEGSHTLIFTLSYYDENDMKCTDTKEVEMNFVSETDMEDVTVNDYVVKSAQELMEAKNKKEALRHYDKGDVQFATNHLQNAQGKMRSFAAAYQVNVDQNLQDMGNLQTSLQTRQMSAEESKVLYSKSYSRTRTQKEES